MADLRLRVGRHVSKGASLKSSAFRRIVAEHLGIASAAAVYNGDYEMTDDDLMRVGAFIDGCRVAWLIALTLMCREDAARPG